MHVFYLSAVLAEVKGIGGSGSRFNCWAVLGLEGIFLLFVEEMGKL